MTIEQFGNSTHYVQKTMVKFHATLLMERSANGFRAELYQLDGFYVEISHSAEPNSKPLIQCLPLEGIDEYLSQIDLSPIHQLLS